VSRYNPFSSFVGSAGVPQAIGFYGNVYNAFSSKTSEYDSPELLNNNRPMLMGQGDYNSYLDNYSLQNARREANTNTVGLIGQGAGLGASIGSAIMPGLGTAVGAGTGALIGGGIGIVSGRKRRNNYRDARMEANQEYDKYVDSFNRSNQSYYSSLADEMRINAKRSNFGFYNSF